MPYVRKNYKKKYTTKKAPTVKKLAQKVNTLAKKVSRNAIPIVSGIKTDFNVDVFTTPAVETSFYSNAPPTNLNDKQYLYSVHLRGRLTQDVENATTQHVRLVIVQDMRSYDNDVAPVWLDVFDSATVYSLRTDTDEGYKTKDFRILQDKLYTLTYDSDATVDNSKIVNLYHRFKKPIRQVNMTGYQEGQIYFMYMSTMATGGIDLDYNALFRFSKDT